jgi:hypothetical protein
MHQLVRFVLPLAEMRRDSVTRSIRARFSAHIGVGGEAGRSFKVVQSATAARLRRLPFGDSTHGSPAGLAVKAGATGCNFVRTKAKE